MTKISRTLMYDAWKDRWYSNMGKAEWTRKLIPDLDLWMRSEFAEVNFATTQLLTGHGSFAAYLHRFEIKDSDQCTQCSQRDSAEHAMYNCGRWVAESWELEGVIGPIPSPEELMGVLLENKGNWLALERLAARVTSSKRKDRQ